MTLKRLRRLLARHSRVQNDGVNYFSGQPRGDSVTSTLVETLEIDATAEFTEDVSDIDRAFLDVARTTYTVSLLLDAMAYPENASPEGMEIRNAIESSVSASEFADDREEYGAALVEAFKCGRNLVNRDDVDALKQDFAGNIDEDTLRELRGTIVYVAGHLGLDVDLPAPDEVKA